MTNPQSALAAGVRPVEVWAWAMFDFANSGYTTVVLTAIFSAYFVSVVAENAAWGTLAWTLSLAVSYALIMFTGPLVGAYADAHAAKKRVLMVTTAACVLATAALATVGRADLALAIALIIVSNYCFGTGENLIAAFLPEIADGESMGKVSGWGWALGYVGGLLSLGLCLAYLKWASDRGVATEAAVPVTMLITAGLFALASLPTFLLLKERAVPQAGPARLFHDTFGRLGETVRRARRFQDLWRFLVCIVFYQAGIQAVISLAAIYAEQAMGFTTKETLTLLLVTNVTASVGALLFGQVQDRIGHKATLTITLLCWIGTIALVWAAGGPVAFWIAANCVGICLGASQSAGRALVGYLSPEKHVAEFFGLWGLAVKLSAILGPVTYGLVSWLSRGDHRLAMMMTGSFFLVGLVLLHTVNVRRGREATLAYNTPA
ncbi:MAG TPA: MFS transporter [Burkholderiales bacterium]|nr:MFS transporter [Burkholderiales bacterium]